MDNLNSDRNTDYNVCPYCDLHYSEKCEHLLGVSDNRPSWIVQGDVTLDEDYNDMYKKDLDDINDRYGAWM